MLETLEPLSGDRKCFRMINGVLTERTVKEVVPILKTNSDGLKNALEELVKQYKSKQDDMEKWKVCCRVERLSCKVQGLIVINRRRTMCRLSNSLSRRVQRTWAVSCSTGSTRVAEPHGVHNECD